MHQNYIKYNAETPPKYLQTFTGKERDSETGFSYFGARYYDSDLMTGWLSVDPMADKYPGVSPYAYCAWNPIKLVDPDGRMIDWVESMGGTIYWDDNATSQETTKAGEKYLGKNVLVGTHGRDENLNESVNAATFDLYLESDHSGPIATIRGNTVPCDVEAYGTLPEGLYKADEQSYKGNTALLITNIASSIPILAITSIIVSLINVNISAILELSFTKRSIKTPEDFLSKSIVSILKTSQASAFCIFDNVSLKNI